VSQLIYTKAIKNGKLKATEMQVGESVTGTLKDVVEKSGKTKDGREFTSYSIILEQNGKDIELYSAGNLKYMKNDVEAGKRQLGAFTVITRVDNITTKSGYPSSKFQITQGTNQAPVAAQAPAAATTTTVSVKEKLAEIQARRGANS
jgi:hypothetical protein